MIGDAILFFLEENNVRLVGRPSAHNWVQFHAETGDYNVRVERDERTGSIQPDGGSSTASRYRARRRSMS